MEKNKAALNYKYAQAFNRDVSVAETGTAQEC